MIIRNTYASGKNEKVLKEKQNISRATVDPKERLHCLFNRQLLSACWMEIGESNGWKKDIVMHSPFSRGSYFIATLSTWHFEIMSSLRNSNSQIPIQILVCDKPES